MQDTIVGRPRVRGRHEHAHVEYAHYIRVATRQGQVNHEATMYQCAMERLQRRTREQ